MRLMGLDIGTKTIGVAVSDLLGWTAQGVEVIAVNVQREQYGLERIQALVEEYAVEAFVIGLPKNMDGSIGERAEASMAYGHQLTERFQLPVYYQDERLTTMQMNRMMIEEGNVSRAKRKKVIDKLAAVMILQTYMDRQH